MTIASTQDIAIAAARAAQDKKANDVLILDVSSLMAEANFFVICSAETQVQIRTIVQEIIDQLEGAGIHLRRHEGRGGNSWVLLDYGGVVVHVFEEPDRAYYNLEKLWADAKRIPIP
ncbi:MAG: ribosome silencing factor [Firmicutes bacterium]|nr:ribosome silencing factor [Bacillota bacterium]